VTAFYVVGAAAALWAVILAALGIRRDRFPSTPRTTRAVMGISALLVAGAIGTAIVAGILEGEHEEEPQEGEAVAAEAAAEEAAPSDAQELELAADPSGDFAFDTTELEAAGGPITLTMANPSPVAHNVSLEGPAVDEMGETVGQDETSTVSAEVEPGEYTFYCSVSGHREGGMEGTLTVE
jgi:plastocyanin